MYIYIYMYVHTHTYVYYIYIYIYIGKRRRGYSEWGCSEPVRIGISRETICFTKTPAAQAARF